MEKWIDNHKFYKKHGRSRHRKKRSVDKVVDGNEKAVAAGIHVFRKTPLWALWANFTFSRGWVKTAMIAIGKTFQSALSLAVEVEALAKQYWQALQIGPVPCLTETQMQAVLERFKTYYDNLKS